MVMTSRSVPARRRAVLSASGRPVEPSSDATASSVSSLHDPDDFGNTGLLARMILAGKSDRRFLQRISEA